MSETTINILQTCAVVGYLLSGPMVLTFGYLRARINYSRDPYFKRWRWVSWRDTIGSRQKDEWIQRSWEAYLVLLLVAGVLGVLVVIIREIWR